MPKLFLTPFVIAGLLLLTSCSSSPEPDLGKINQEKLTCEEVKKTINELEIEIATTSDRSKFYRLRLLTQQYLLLENEECFNQIDIAQAKAFIDLVKANLYPYYP